MQVTDANLKSALINRLVTLCILVLAFALSINWVTEQNEQPEDSSPRNDPDFYMLNASIRQFGGNGQLRHTLKAGRFTHFPLTDLTAMQMPGMTITVAGSAPWKITAREGRIINESKYREEAVELWDTVIAEKPGRNNKFISIRTDSLTVYPEREYAETNEKVRIDSETGSTTAAGMKAFLDRGNYLLHSTDKDRVRTTFRSNWPSSGE